MKTNQDQLTHLKDFATSEGFLKQQMASLDIRDNLPPQMMAVISSVLEALETLEQGGNHED